MSEGKVREHFHQAAWEEPLLMTLGHLGRRAILLPTDSDKAASASEDVLSVIPAVLRRTEPPQLPELSQPEVIRHFTRLSQMVLANNVAVSLGLGTTTMKYNPPIHELLTRSEHLADLHPFQDQGTVQGILKIVYDLGVFLEAISGMERFTLQPGGGSQGILTNAMIIKAYHADRGESGQRDEIITTIFSHPADAATPATAGCKVVTLYPGPRGYPELDALKAAVSERTAGLMITNPEDTGIFNPDIAEFVRVVHDAGGLCAYDQANANGTLGITRARDAGFDMCQFNLHKTFAVPHGCMGGAVGAVGVQKDLVQYLPSPTVEREGERYFLDFDRPRSIGSVRAGIGNAHSIVKAYAWILSMGAAGLRAAAECSVLNNNYLAGRIAGIRGATISYLEGNPARRLEQVRYSWEKLAEETGVGTADVHNRVIDFGVQGYFTSHHPWIVPEPFTLEPTESCSREELDEFAAILARISQEAYTDPSIVKGAPYNSTTARVLPEGYEHPAMTWRAFLNQGLAERSSRPGDTSK